MGLLELVQGFVQGKSEEERQSALQEEVQAGSNQGLLGLVGSLLAEPGSGAEERAVLENILENARLSSAEGEPRRGRQGSQGRTSKARQKERIVEKERSTREARSDPLLDLLKKPVPGEGSQDPKKKPNTIAEEIALQTLTRSFGSTEAQVNNSGGELANALQAAQQQEIHQEKLRTERAKAEQQELKASNEQAQSESLTSQLIAQSQGTQGIASPTNGVASSPSGLPPAPTGDVLGSPGGGVDPTVSRNDPGRAEQAQLEQALIARNPITGRDSGPGMRAFMEDRERRNELLAQLDEKRIFNQRNKAFQLAGIGLNILSAPAKLFGLEGDLGSTLFGVEPDPSLKAHLILNGLGTASSVARAELEYQGRQDKITADFKLAIARAGFPRTSGSARDGADFEVVKAVGRKAESLLATTQPAFAPGSPLVRMFNATKTRLIEGPLAAQGKPSAFFQASGMTLEQYTASLDNDVATAVQNYVDNGGTEETLRQDVIQAQQTITETFINPESGNESLDRFSTTRVNAAAEFKGQLTDTVREFIKRKPTTTFPKAQAKKEVSNSSRSPKRGRSRTGRETSIGDDLSELGKAVGAAPKALREALGIDKSVAESTQDQHITEANEWISMVGQGKGGNIAIGAAQSHIDKVKDKKLKNALQIRLDAAVKQ